MPNELDLKEMEERVTQLVEENHELKQMIGVLEQMSVHLMPIVLKCKCDYNSVKLKTKLSVLTQKYDSIKQKNKKCLEIIRKINKSSQNVPKIVVKKVDNCFEENECSAERRGRGRPPKAEPKEVYEAMEPPMDPTVEDKCNNSNVLHKRRVDLIKEKGIKICRKYNKKRVNKEMSNNSSKDGLKRETINRKRNESQVYCEECGKRFRDSYELRFHMWRHTGRKLFRCDWPGCDKEFSSKYLLKHQKSHSNPKRFLCQFSECQQSFESSVELGQHFQDSHEGHKPFRCSSEGCSHEFTAKANLIQHHSWVHSHVLYRCAWPGCDDAFKRKHLLTDHINTKHKGQAKYGCEWPGCEFRTGHSKSFARHKLIHSGEKPYPCTWAGCEWRFRQPHQLKAHQLIHTGESPVACQVQCCDQRFKTRRVMLSHLKKVHPRRQV